MNKKYDIYYIFDDDGLDVPMIAPSEIPHGYQQRWDSTERKYVFTPIFPTFLEKLILRLGKTPN